jgi:hypothetical protein
VTGANSFLKKKKKTENCHDEKRRPFTVEQQSMGKKNNQLRCHVASVHKDGYDSEKCEAEPCFPCSMNCQTKPCCEIFSNRCGYAWHNFYTNVSLIYIYTQGVS